jgi:ABC-type phosphate transport system substrate-binding protein
MRSWRSVFVLVWMCAACSLAEARQLAVVTDTANTVLTLTSADLIKIFTLHTRNWPDGKAITIVVRDPASSDMDLVLRKLLNMTLEQAQAFIQAHKGSILVAGSDDAVIRFVANNRGAIGIIDLYSLTKDVNVLKIDGKLPVEQGYLLRGREVR